MTVTGFGLMRRGSWTDPPSASVYTRVWELGGAQYSGCVQCLTTTAAKLDSISDSVCAQECCL